MQHTLGCTVTLQDAHTLFMKPLTSNYAQRMDPVSQTIDAADSRQTFKDLISFSSNTQPPLDPSTSSNSFFENIPSLHGQDFVISRNKTHFSSWTKQPSQVRFLLKQSHFVNLTTRATKCEFVVFVSQFHAKCRSAEVGTRAAVASCQQITCLTVHLRRAGGDPP